jgi:mono/diheme cytochrome c family protein
VILGANPVGRNIAIVIAIVLTLFWLAYVIGNLRRAKAEVGSEVELAPNRKPYLNDEELEGRKLTRVLLLGLGLVVVTAFAIPLYWLNEPSRQAGAIEGFDARFAKWGEELFAPTAQGGFNCAGCHGTKGHRRCRGVHVARPGHRPRRGGELEGCALQTVLLKFSEDEVRYIITYGRPFSPMSPWGLAGGGPMNDQQIDTLIAYLRSIQLTPEEAQAAVTKALADAKADPVNAGKSDGELLFNMQASSGTYSCARCHTHGWSYDQPVVSGGGAMGPNLTGGSEGRQFPSEADQNAFVHDGSDQGKRYGQQGQGTGRMPGFGQIYSQEQIAAVVAYERGL